MNIGVNLFRFFANTSMTLELVVWPMTIGLLLAAAMALYGKRVLGAFVRKLQRMRAVSPETAVTLADAGFSGNPFIRFALRRRGGYRRVVCGIPTDAGEVPATDFSGREQVEANGQQYPSDTVSLDEMKFFIPSVCAEKADSLYASGSSSVVVLLFAIVIFVAAAVILCVWVPKFVQLVLDYFVIIIRALFSPGV